MSVKLTSNSVSWEQPTQLFINNQFVDAVSGKTIVSVDPCTEKEIATVQAAGPEDIDRAVKAARVAFRDIWRHTSGTERGVLLFNLAQEVEKQADLLATIETLDTGKPRFTNANGDVEECISIYRYYAGYADKIEGRVTMDDPKRLSYTRHQPFGVVAAVIPWNYPLATACWKLAPALAAGNTVVLKTAENTPLSMLYFAKLVQKVGFPPGVINIVSGHGAEAGNALASHMDVDKFSFTGSTGVGQAIMEQAARSNLKDVTLELGGKSAMVVFEDCDIEQAAKWAYFGIMYNAGQVCCATSRLIIEDSIYDKFVAAVTKVVEEQAIIGDVYKEDTNHGPQISKAQFDRILAYIDTAKKEGAKITTGGERWGSKGYYIKPTVLADVKTSDTVAQEEIFGPVVVCVKFKGYDDAIRIANDSKYGLGGAVFTNDITKAHKAANDMDTGTIWINSSNDQDYHLPFGGHKMSGIGSELGGYGIDSYLRPKSVQVNLGYKL